jgi:purine-binding chemotaxis protein CheW
MRALYRTPNITDGSDYGQDHMNKADLIASLSEETGMTKRKAKQAVDVIFGKITDALAGGDRVRIRGFCSLSVKEHKAYTARNPNTGEPVQVNPRKVPSFKCGSKLKQKVVQQVETTNLPPTEPKGLLDFPQASEPTPDLKQPADSDPTPTIAQQTETWTRPQRDMTAMEGKYLTFTLGEEDFCIGILAIREIVGIMPVTTIPQTPEFVRGVINLRGQVIPVVDLRARFGMDTVDATERTCIIVVEIAAGARNIQMGIIVDSVSEVLNIKADEIEDSPTFGAKLDTEYILGMAKMDGGVKILLDIDLVLSGQEVMQLQR